MITALKQEIKLKDELLHKAQVKKALSCILRKPLCYRLFLRGLPDFCDYFTMSIDKLWTIIILLKISLMQIKTRTYTRVIWFHLILTGRVWRQGCQQCKIRAQPGQEFGRFILSSKFVHLKRLKAITVEHRSSGPYNGLKTANGRSTKGHKNDQPSVLKNNLKWKLIPSYRTMSDITSSINMLSSHRKFGMDPIN